MKKILCFILTLCTAAAVVSCGKSKSSDSKSVPETTASTAASTGSDDVFTNDGYTEKIMEKIKDMQVSDEPFEFKEHGELVVPEKDEKDAELGSYYESADGVKLYYEKNDHPRDMILTLEKYFTSYAEGDYTQYSRCVFPGYIDEMEAFLQKDYGYGMKKSFATQCSNLASNVSGDFKVTRIKLEKTENLADDAVEKFFSSLDKTFNKDYYSEVKKNCDKLHYVTFYVIAENSKGEEVSLITGYDIVFAEKDGRFYTFG